MLHKHVELVHSARVLGHMLGDFAQNRLGQIGDAKEAYRRSYRKKGALGNLQVRSLAQERRLLVEGQRRNSYERCHH